MSQRVTRASARLNSTDTNSLTQDSPPTATDAGSSPTTLISTSRKRKAPTEPSPNAAREPRKSKRAKGDLDELQTPDPPREARKNSSKRTTAAMSSVGPSSGTSGEPSPQQTPRDSSKRKSSRKKGKEDPSSAVPSGSSSRKSKKSSKKDQDVVMKDADEKADGPKDGQPGDDEDDENPDTGGGGDGSDDPPPPRRFTEDELDAMERDDPFLSGYFGRGGPGGLSSSLRALSGMMSGNNARLRGILEQLRTKEDPSVQLIALTELSELLLVSNEDNLAGHFAPDQYVKELVALMQPNEMTGEENPEMMLLACRCIANMMEALPASTTSVVYGGAVPVLCQKLLEIHFIDLAEQALSTLEKISVEFPSSIVREGGLTACLTYLDFFATSTQRTAVTTAANCCRNIPDDSFPVVRDVMPILLNTLSSSDQKVVEQASLCVSRVIDSFKYNETRLEELVSADLLKAILRLLLPGSTNMIGQSIHTQFLRVLSITARASPRLSVELLKMNVVDTLYQILTGVSAPAGTDDAASQIDKNIIMQAIIRTPREQVFETLNVICELLPTVPRDGLTFLDDLYEAGYAVAEHVSTANRPNKTSPNDKRVELLKECPKEAKRFAVVLFPTLMHAYTSTVNLSVRQKVLTAQLKMLSNFDTDILEAALQGVTYASHLAATLTQQENSSLVTFALQAAELLLKRMEAIYRPQFYREGVMSEITKLADRPLKPQPPADEKPEAKPEPVAEVEVLEQHDEEMADDEPEAIEVDVEPHESEDDDEGHDDDEDEGRRVRDEDEEEDDDDDEPRGDDHSDDSEPPSPHVPRVTDMQDIITMHAKQFIEAHASGDNEKMREEALRVLSDLQELAADLRECYSSTQGQEGKALFRRLAKHFDGNALQSITSYELMSSGIVDTLVTVFNSPDEDSATKARSDFLEIFMATVNNSNLAVGDAKSPSTAFSVLIMKLQDLLSRSEHFEVVTVNHNAYESSRNPASALLAKQLRLKLIADDDSGIPKPFRNIMVAIHAIATFKALDDYLRPRVSLAERPRGVRSRDLGSMAAYAAAMTGRPLPKVGGPPPPMPPAPGSSLGSSLPTRSASKKPSRSKSSKSESAAQAESSTAEEKSLRRSSRRRSAAAAPPTMDEPLEPSPEPEESQQTLECADETNISDGEDDEDVGADLDALVDDLEEGAFGHDAPDPSAVNIEAGNSGKVTARAEDGTRIGTPTGNTPVSTPTTRDRMSATARLLAAREMLNSPSSASRPSSYAAALQTPQDWHIEFSVNDQPISSDSTIYRACHYNNAQGEEFAGRSMWHSTHTIKFKRVQGPPPSEKSPISGSSGKSSTESGLPPSLDKHPITSNILRLMSILHDLNNNLEDVLAEHKTAVNLNAEPLSQFVNTKLTAKLNRQLEEPLIVASNCLPNWSDDLARLYPFLFPFETRQLFLQSTSFGYARVMSRWHNGGTDTENRNRRDAQFLGRVQRQKVRISRSRILESAMKVMELYGQSPSILEVEYFEEVGTGLGPTLEFYSNVSKEFSKKKTKMWRENESDASKEFAFGRRGLFPAPMNEETAKSDNGQKILHLFKMLGKFVARSMLDSRIIDVSFNPVFFRVSDDSSAVTPSLGAVAAVDQDLARSLKVLKKYISAKQRIEDDDRLNEAQKAAKIDQIRINDAKIEDLGLDFTLPGYADIQLVPGGDQIDLTLDNAGDYIKRVIDLTLGTGVQRQIDAFRAGFTKVFPYSALTAFTPDELTMLFGQVEEDWSLETLMDSIKADHGFNIDSKSVRNLLQVMSELDTQHKRDFLQFVTGSPKLPIGGFKALTPMFTVVCKPSEPPLTSDDYLPSVMTCVNYLKMPDYSSLEILKTKLAVAIKEGQGAFHLS